MPHRSAVRAAALGCLFAAGCGGGTEPSSSTNTPRTPASLQTVSGTGQSAVVGSTLSAALVVRVRDASGAAVSGATVQWTTTSGSIAPSSSITDAGGNATASWTLGTAAGSATALATAGSASAQFTATASADRAARIVVTGDSLVLGTWGETGSLSAQVLDRYGNVVTPASVTFSSTDTTVAKIDAVGRVTSGRAGVAVVAMAADTARGSARVVVPVQRNAACRIPTAEPARGTARGAAKFTEEAGTRFPPNVLTGSIKDVVVVDFDRDGNSDVLVADANGGAPGPAQGRLLAFRNAGTAFTDVTTSALGATPLTTINAQFNATADFNGDGMTDVFFGQSGYDSAPFPGLRNLLLLATAGGGFREVGQTSLSPDPVGFTHGASAADIDCDGDQDIVENDIHASATTTQSFRVQVNTGGGQFQDRAASLIPEAVAKYAELGNAAWLAVALCDFDRDGDPDLAAGSWSSPRTIGVPVSGALFVNDGFGHFRSRAGALPADTFGAATDVDDVRCADFDGDGWNDVVLSTIEKSASDAPVGGRTVFWRNNHDMTFTDITSQWAPNQWPQSTYPLRAIVADFNADGWPDVLATGYGNPFNGFWTSGVGGNAIFYNRGSAGGFTRSALDNWFGALWPIDVNGDGRLDLLWAGAIQTPDQPPQALPRVYVQP